MSFAKEVKDELAQTKNNLCCKKAELSAFLHLNTEIIINHQGIHLLFQTINPAIARRLITLIKENYNLEIELQYKKQTLTNNQLYLVEIKEAKKITEDFLMFESKASEKLLTNQNECCIQAYLRGAFMAMGSINNPKNSYHLEIKCKNENDAIYIQKLFNHYNLNGKISKRRNELIVYLKEASRILDFLNLIGAKKNFFQFHEIMTNREFSNSVNRALNCEIANEEKVIKAAQEQLHDIHILKTHLILDKIDPKIKELMELRKKYPYISMNELREQFFIEYNYQITKSGLHHRFRKMHQMVEEIILNHKGDNAI